MKNKINSFKHVNPSYLMTRCRTVNELFAVADKQFSFLTARSLTVFFNCLVKLKKEKGESEYLEGISQNKRLFSNIQYQLYQKIGSFNSARDLASIAMSLITVKVHGSELIMLEVQDKFMVIINKANIKDIAQLLWSMTRKKLQTPELITACTKKLLSLSETDLQVPKVGQDLSMIAISLAMIDRADNSLIEWLENQVSRMIEEENPGREYLFDKQSIIKLALTLFLVGSKRVDILYKLKDIIVARGYFKELVFEDIAALNSVYQENLTTDLGFERPITARLRCLLQEGGSIYSFARSLSDNTLAILFTSYYNMPEKEDISDLLKKVMELRLANIPNANNGFTVKDITNICYKLLERKIIDSPLLAKVALYVSGMPDIKIGFRLREIMRFMELSILFSRLKLLDKIKLKQITPLFVQAIQEYSERFSCGIEGIVSIYRLYATAEVSDEPLFDVLNCLARRDLEGSSSLLRSPVDGSELITIYWSLAKVKYLKLDFFRQTQRSLIKFLSNKDLKISEKEITKLFWALSSSNIYSKVVFDLLIQRYSLILDSFLAGEKTDISLYGLSTNSMALAQSRIKDDNFLEKVEKTVFKLAETIATKDVMLEYSFILLAMAKLSYKSQDICRLVLDSIRQNSKDLTSSMAINLLYAFILLDKLPKDISFILVNIINSSISIESNKEKRRLLRADELLTKYTEDICLDKALIENTKKEIASIYALPPMGSGFQDAVSDVFYDMELEYKQEVKVGPYFTDFVVTQGDLVGTVVEVDGVQYHGYRDSSQSTSEELLRAEIINKYGYNIVHIRSDKWQELDNESRIDWIEKLLSID